MSTSTLDVEASQCRHQYPLRHSSLKPQSRRRYTFRYGYHNLRSLAHKIPRTFKSSCLTEMDDVIISSTQCPVVHSTRCRKFPQVDGLISYGSSRQTCARPILLRYIKCSRDVIPPSIRILLLSSFSPLKPPLRDSFHLVTQPLAFL